MRVFIAISLILHLALFSTIVGVGISKKQKSQYNVYEVSIVAPMPYSRAATQPEAALAEAKKYVRPETSTIKGFSEIAKEQAVKEKAPSFKPIELEPKLKGGKGDKQTAQPEGPNLSSEPWASAGMASNAWEGSQESIENWKNSVKKTIKDHLNLKGIPSKIPHNPMFRLKISRNGQLISKSLILSSKNISFDKALEIAMNKVTNLPVPPRAVLGDNPFVEVVMEFEPPSGY
jgi:hypothetical protein